MPPCFALAYAATPRIFAADAAGFSARLTCRFIDTDDYFIS
jgi:hypothetical protein